MGGSKAKFRKQKQESTTKTESIETSRNQEISWNDIKHFTPREFTCKCDGLCDHPVVISLELVAKLDSIRDSMGRSIGITSGTRCERHNQRVGGKRRSAHTPKNGVSHAVDVHCPDSAFRYAFLKSALPLFNRIGIAKSFIHVDDDPELPGNVIWVY